MVGSPPKPTESALERYMQLPYRMDIYWDGDYWAVEFPELPGLATDSEGWEQLPAAIDQAKRVWFLAMIEDGRPIPEPRPLDEGYSGQLRVRMPKSLHGELDRLANREGVSLNTLILTALAQYVGGEHGRGGAISPNHERRTASAP